MFGSSKPPPPKLSEIETIANEVGVTLPALSDIMKGQSITITNNSNDKVRVYPSASDSAMMEEQAYQQEHQQDAWQHAAIHYTLMDKLRVRLNMHPTAEMPFEHINPIKNPTNDKVVVFLIVRGVPMFIEDDAALFPTDSLVGKLNLLR